MTKIAQLRLRHFVTLFVFWSLSHVDAQSTETSNVNLQSAYLFEIPIGKLADRYGVNNKFEFKLEFLSKNQWAFYLKSGLRFGDRVKEDALAPLRTKEGYVIGANGFYADVFGRKRGFDYAFGIDKLIPLDTYIKSNHQIRIGLAIIRTAHWVKLIDDSQSVTQILGKYSNLYDRYTSGFGIEENVQFQYNTKANNAAFLIGLQLSQSFTTEHRATHLGLDQNRIDMYLGAKLSYLLPLYTFSDQKSIFY